MNCPVHICCDICGEPLGVKSYAENQLIKQLELEIKCLDSFVHCDNNGICLFTVIYIQIKYLFPDSISKLWGAKNIFQLGIYMSL